MRAEISIGHGHWCLEILSLHFAVHNHHIGKPEYVLHPDSSGAWGEVFPMDNHPIRV